jgi:hypothetical protein
VASGVKCGPHGGKKSKRKSLTGAGVGQRLTIRVCTRGLRWFTTKSSGYLVEPQNKTGGSAGGDRTRAHREASMPADTWWDRRACVGRTRTAAKAWPCDEEECYMTYFPLRSLYLNLCARGILVICPTRRDSYILALLFLGKPSIRIASYFLAP